jgi:hypothetical protein
MSMVPYTAPIYIRFYRDFFKEVLAGGVGNGKENILLKPIAFISRITLYKGNLHIYG